MVGSLDYCFCLDSTVLGQQVTAVQVAHFLRLSNVMWKGSPQTLIAIHGIRIKRFRIRIRITSYILQVRLSCYLLQQAYKGCTKLTNVCNLIHLNVSLNCNTTGL